MRLIAIPIAAMIVGGCLAEDVTPENRTVAIMTVPERMFAARAGEAVASVQIADGTPIIGANIAINCATEGPHHACIAVSGIRQCSRIARCGSDRISILIPMREVAADKSPVLLSLYGDATEISGVLAISPLPDLL
jgi:hypothetical protein